MLTSTLQYLSRWILPLLLLGPVAKGIAADDVIERPQVRAGDSWTYRQTSLITRNSGDFSYRVTGVGADRIKTVSDGFSDLYTTDWNLIESSAGIKIAPHEGYFQFPLEPGKTYAFKSERTVARMRTPWEGTVTVADWETIDVPAGRFRALRVDINGSFGHGPPARRARLQLSYWWSTDVKRWVRYDLWMSKPASKATDFNTRTELVQYAPAS